jgi:MerR family transcriptional regulator, thiopeptide resistance regulator
MTMVDSTVQRRIPVLVYADTGGVETAGLSVVVDDVDAHYRRAKELGAEIRYEPQDMPYGVREYALRDLEQRLWAVMTPLA